MKNVNQYSKSEFAITAQFTGNPFDKVINCKVISPKNETFLTELFYNGGKEFIARIYTDVVGEYSYEIFDEEKVYESGNFNCVKKDGLHGKFRQSKADPTKIEYYDGTPYYMLGFEVDWLFLLDDLQEDFPKAKVLIDTIDKYKFNMAVVSLYARDVTWSERIGGYGTEFDFSNPKQGPFKQNPDNYEDTDYDTLDVDFFKRVDKIMDYLCEKDISVHFMIYVWNKFVKWAPLFSEQDNRFYNYVINRYMAYPNMLWDVSKEALSYGVVTEEDIYNKAKILREKDVYKTLVTVHDGGFCKNHPDVIDMHSIQNWEFNLMQGMLDITNLGHNNIVCNVEHGGYEKGIYAGFHGAYVDPVICLERNYICMFVGLYTVYYWQNSSWNIVVWDMDSLADDFKPKLEYYKNMANFMKDIKFETLKPSDMFNKRKLALEDDKYMYILKPTGMSHLTLWKMNPEIGSDVLWFNPVTNEYISQEMNEYDRTYGYPSPWGEDLSIVRICKP